MRLAALGTALLISAAGGTISGTQAAVPAQSDKDVTITGCVVKGEGGYVLMPLPEEGGTAAALPPAATSGSSTSSALPAGAMRVLYWLDDDDLEDHAGQRVEVKGELTDDLDKGEVSVERKDNGLIEVEFKHEGKEISVKLPNVPSSVGTGGVSDKEKDYEFVVRKVDVKDVKTLASVCQ